MTFQIKIEILHALLAVPMPSILLVFISRTQDDNDDEVTPGYVAPKQVDLRTIQELDADDEALVKYKATLLGQTEAVKGMCCEVCGYVL